VTGSVAAALTSHMFFFFFFQAEDGIRDGHVTGVQTCALPIFAGGRRSVRRGGGGAGTRLVAMRVVEVRRAKGEERAGGERAEERSEERRVGKECRSGWGAEY